VKIACVSLNSCIDRTLSAPEFEAGRHCQASFLQEKPAGKGVNLARLLAALEIPVTLFGFVGEDAAARFAELLEAAGVENRLQAVPVRTRVNTTLVVPGRGRETHVRERGEAIPAYALPLLEEEMQRTLQAGDWALFAGSIPPGVDAAAFGDLVGRLAANGIRVAADTSGPALRAAVAAGCSLIKPNESELAELTGTAVRTADDIREAARQVRQPPARADLAVLASAGADGAYLFAPEGDWHAWPAGRLPVRPTVGARAALLAGFLAARFAGQPPEPALRRAIQVASASVGCLQAGELDAGQMSVDVRSLALSPEMR